MFINKIFLSIVLTTFVAYGLADELTAYDSFTLNEFHGVWHVVAAILPSESGLRYTCEWLYIVPKLNTDVDFEVTFETVANGKALQAKGNGHVINSKVHLVFPSITPIEINYGVTKFNFGDVLILHNQGSVPYSLLMSRTYTVSAEAKAAFENKAAVSGLKVTYITFEGCTY